MNKKLKILMSGGGTGGHIFPAVAIADEIKKRFPNAEFLFIGANGKMEMEKVPQSGYSIKGLDIIGFNRSNLLSNIKLPFIVYRSLQDAKKYIKDFNPDIAIGTGGFASGPALFAASRLGIPTFIQEQNAHAGITNKILSRKAKVIFTAYPNIKGFPENKTKFLGNPIRSSIISNIIDASTAKEQLNLSKDKLTILSFGGSLGSKTLNEGWSKNIQNISNKDYQLIWQTGKTQYDDIIKQHPPESLTANIVIKQFIKDMALAYSAADVIVSRAGAIAISELAVARKPVVLVPLPFAAEDHQMINAKSLADKNAARIVKDVDMDENFWKTLLSITENPELMKEMSENIELFAKPRATEQIVDEIVKQCIA